MNMIDAALAAAKLVASTDCYAPEVSWCVKDFETWQALRRATGSVVHATCYRPPRETPYVIEVLEAPGLRAQFTRPLTPEEKARTMLQTWEAYAVSYEVTEVRL